MQLTALAVLRLFLGVVKYDLMKKHLELICSSEEYVDFCLKISVLLLDLLVTLAVMTEVFNPESQSS